MNFSSVRTSGFILTTGLRIINVYFIEKSEFILISTRQNTQRYLLTFFTWNRRIDSGKSWNDLADGWKKTKFKLGNTNLYIGLTVKR